MNHIIKKGLLALTIALFACTSCGKDQLYKSTEILILIDQTESFFRDQVDPKACMDFIVSQIGFSPEEAYGGELHLIVAPLNELVNNRNQEVILQGVDNLLLTVIKKRKEEQQAFIKDAIRIIEQGKERKKSYSSSQLVPPLMKHLQRLANSSADRKIVLLYSDLMQNGDGMFFYSDSQEDIQTYLEAQFEKYNASFSGIELYTIYEPQQKEEDQRFEAVRPIYEQVFSAQGIAFKHQTNL